MRLTAVLTLVLTLLFSGIAYAQGAPAAQEVSRDDIEAMVKKACDWLKTQQAADGSWDFLDRPFSCGVHASGKGLGEGCTAFCTFALLKGGVSRKDPVVQKGIQSAIQKIGTGCHCYCAACLILLLEAYYVGDELPKDKKEEKKGDWVTEVTKKDEDPARKIRKRAPAQHLKLIEDLVKYLISKQEPQKLVWRYPGGSGDIVDASNTQYVMLALAAALRMKIPVPANTYINVVKYCLDKQEKDGPEVPWFPVPAADHDFKDLKKIEKQMVKDMRKLEREYKREERKNPDGVPKKEDWGTTVIEEAQRKIFKGEKKKMFARGWAYMPEDDQNRDWCKAITGSMTTSGCISLIIAKHALEEMGQLPSNIKKAVNKGIRDGAAWLAHKWRTDMNPSSTGSASHLIYYWYGLERVGILGLVPKFGTHEWYKEGVSFFKGSQRPDGSWDAGNRGTSGPVPDTAWGILFLRRATTPLIRVPERPLTGEGLFGPAKKQEK